MAFNILLYGVTGFSGSLIASELRRLLSSEPGAYRIVLAGRDAAGTKALAKEHRMDYCVFGLDERKDVRHGLADMDVVINAAGPFAWTAERLSKVALEMGCHYVDINGEADVYRKLDDLDLNARQHGVAMVCGAGFWAAASDLLLDKALQQLPASSELGAIRIAMSRIRTFSRGSASTVWRSLREQVTVVRKGLVDDGRGGQQEGLVLWHEPVGKLERTFDFRHPRDKLPDRRIASAASLVDTLTARLTVARNGRSVDSIESYVESGFASRFAYQVGSLLAPLAAMPAVRALVQQPLALLAEGPTKDEREQENHLILLEIDDVLHSRVINWRWETPNVYQFTAQLAAAVATQLPSANLVGWCTPAEVLGPLNLSFSGDAGPLRGCRLHEWRT